MSEENNNIRDEGETSESENKEKIAADTEAENGTTAEGTTEPVADAAEGNALSEKASALLGTEADGTEKTCAKKPKRVALSTFVCVCVSCVLAAVMLTYALCSSLYQKKLADARLENITVGTASGSYDELELLKQIFLAYSFEELDEETIKTQVLKAYVAATGDRYAEYYTDEEYKAITAEMAGDSQGIGINIINSEVEVGGATYKALKIINVIKDSPAEKAGLKFGDFIIAVGSLEKNDYETLNELGYDMGLKRLQGTKGTVAEFVVCRDGKNIDFSITRDEFTTSSVMSRVVDSGVSSNTGVIKIIQFDLTTPSQLKEAVEALKAQGCDKFVFDLRSNPGGELSSIVATLSFFLEEGDTVISVKDKAGNETVTNVAPVTSTSGCSVAAEDIGIYKDLNMVVLCNGNTASAAELFVANVRDHGLGTIVGTKTYGKGSVQSYMNLSYFGYSGVLKLTRYMYYPPNGESYDGIGIVPHVSVELSDEASGKNVYDIMGTATDNQLVEAVKHFK